MTTRRAVPSTSSDKDSLHDASSPASTPSDISPAVPTSIIVKLLLFSLALIILPISSYFVSRDWLFSGNAAYAGGFAALIANVVLAGYLVVAFQDDKKEQAEAAAERRKDR